MKEPPRKRKKTPLSVLIETPKTFPRTRDRHDAVEVFMTFQQFTVVVFKGGSEPNSNEH